MRSLLHTASPVVANDSALTLAEWEALPVHTRVAQRTADILVLLGVIREQLHTEEGSPLLWLEEPLDRMTAEADRVLRRLAM
ncbi:MAG TPA: hypothetical protein VEO54_24610 [Thermoanaerobaculia bacterium]|nr:hypothetical protein [Thermoanaerobaculia bacterium]